MARTAPTKERRRKPRKPRAAPADVLALLAPEYGDSVPKPRLDPISELVFTILSQHTSDLNSERAFHSLFAHFGSWEAVAAADPEQIAEPIRTGGLAQVKAPRVKAVLQRVLDLRGSLDISFLKDLPLNQAKAWLLALPGIGPKTAAVVLCFSLGMPAMAVDTHVHRVSKRLGFIGPKVTADQAHPILEGMVQPDEVYPFHVYLITHGRRVCKAQRPLCGECVLEWGCPSSQLLPS